MEPKYFVLFILAFWNGDCYEDSISARLLLFQLKSDDMTPEVCKTICFDQKNFQYAGVQYAKECYCGNDAPPISKLVPKSQCNLPCLGDSSKKCGAVFRMNIYKKE